MTSIKRIIIILPLLASCVSAAQTAVSTDVINIYSTPAARPWLAELYDCASNNHAAIRLSTQDADISLRVGQPEALVTPAYEIDQDEILVVTHRESPIQNLTLEEARNLFAMGNASAQVWIYAAGEDIQAAFDQLVMQGRSVTSLARMASSPQQMSDVLNSESNAIGILPRHWMTGNPRVVYSAGIVPVLAITQKEPQGATKELIACLQQ